VHVLVATDGSQQSLAAAHRASELLRAADHVTLLSVVTEIPGDDAGGFEGSVYTPEEQEKLWAAELAEAGEELARTARALSASGQIDKRIEVGDVANTVCHVAEELGVDVIVVGSHGRTGLERIFLGSVSEHVVRHAPCPVLVVRVSPREGDHQRKP
jgi:nucleotide-binding universal stress UspA family protein